MMPTPCPVLLSRHPHGRCKGPPYCAKRHGNEGHYQAGCRCWECRDEHRIYRQDGRRMGRDAMR
jgi:hypothetical protein